MQYIAIGGRTTVNPEEVVLLEADINYTTIHFANGRKHLVATPLKRLEERFQGFNFFRANRTFLVNLSCVDHYSDISKLLFLTDSKTLHVSRRREMALKRWLDLPLNGNCYH